MSVNNQNEEQLLISNTLQLCEYNNLDQLKAKIEEENKLQHDVNRRTNRKIDYINLHNEDYETCLHLAVKSGYQDMVKYILSQKPDLSITNPNIGTVLHYAVKYRSANLFETLLSYREIVNGNIIRLDINEVNNRNETPLMAAVKDSNPSIEVIKALFDNEQIDCDIADKYKLYPVHYAANKANRPLVQQLHYKCNLKQEDHQGLNSLYYATFNNLQPDKKIEFIRFFLTLDKFDINKPDHKGKTIAHHIVEQGKDPELFSFWLSQNINLDIKDRDNKTIVDYVRDPKKIKFKQILDEYLVRFNQKKNDADVKDLGKEETATSLPELKFNHEYVFSNKKVEGTTLLHLAACFGFKATMEHLLKNGSSLDIVDKNGNTPLNASIMGPIYAKEFLFNYKEIGIKDIYISSQSYESFAWILAKTTDLNQQNNQGLFPIHVAVKSSNTKVLTDLVQKNKNIINAIDKNGQTVLHYAIYILDLNLIEQLIKLGVDLNIADIHGCKPIHLSNKIMHNSEFSSLQQQAAKLILINFINQGVSIDGNCKREVDNKDIFIKDYDVGLCNSKNMENTSADILGQCGTLSTAHDQN